MAFESGGYADKLGNRHEGRWLVKQLLRLLNEEISSITIEAIGDDEQGVDLIVVGKNDIRQFQQCKARNASNEFWDITDLHNRGILKNMLFQLNRNVNYEFALVSGVPASTFGDICESARKSNNNAEDFYSYQILKLGETRKKVFRKFCEYLGLDPEQKRDREKAFRYLQRMHVILWVDDQNSWNELLGLADILINGEPELAIGTLAEFAQSSIRKSISALDIRTHLTQSGLYPRDLTHDERVAPAVERLGRAFEDSIRPILISRELIPRDETQAILESLDKTRIVILHGASGLGKSSILYELTQKLKLLQRPYIAVRLDRQQPRNTAKQFGKELGLPASPVLCLASLIKQQGGVLIVDQLDALRWTSSHSPNSLSVCNSMIQEIQQIEAAGKPISVIIACRTFDLEHDPAIKNWLDQFSVKDRHLKIEVKKLRPDIVKSIVKRAQGDFERLREKEKLILSSPQHLAMWVNITSQTRIHEFHSATALMREFWNHQYRMLEQLGINSEETDHILDELVDYMEHSGNLVAPANLISTHQKALSCLYTQEIIRKDGHRVCFCHQSYLDFRIAERLLRQIHHGQGDICTWLGSKEAQSLFRREQLRQVLVLLSDDDPKQFIKSVRALLFNNDIRFHLKHLALTVLGQLEQPTQDMIEFSCELLLNNQWRVHAIEFIYWGSVPFVQSLISSRIMQSWLASSNPGDVNDAILLLRSVHDKSGDWFAEMLLPYSAENKDWLDRIISALGFSVERDSDKTFELRLELLKKGHAPAWIDWNSLASANPTRVIKILEAAISTWDSTRLEENSLTENQRARFEHWQNEDVKSLSNTARRHPLETWDRLIPHIERLTAVKLDEYDNQLDDWLEPRLHGLHYGYITLSRGIVTMVLEAGKELAKTKPNEFICRTKVLQNSISPIIQEILIHSYAALHPIYSDEGIKWLLSDPSRFALGPGYSEPEWAPAVKLISGLSPHCSEELFRKLEDAILHYHSPNEKQMAKFYLTSWKQGFFGDYWGRAQFFLLPALSAKRRKSSTEALIRVLKRKFGTYPEHRFLRSGQITGGLTGSPLPKDKLHLIGDNAWLRIITNKNIPETNHTKLKQIAPDIAAESSITHFADDLRAISCRYPERFGQLALKFPKDVNTHYLAAILNGIKTVKPENLPSEEQASWKPAKIRTIEAILETFQVGDDYNTATTFCWLLHGRPDENWSDKTIDRLLRYARFHEDPIPGRLNIYSHVTGNNVNTASVQSLEDNKLNCVRGVAGLAIGALLWKHPDWLEKLRTGIESLIIDPHIVVRVAAIDACLPIINIDRDFAVNCFITACQSDYRVAATREAVYYFNSCMNTHFEQLSTVILKMLASENNEIAEEGALEVCARWLFLGMFQSELEKCKSGKSAHRKGIAQIAIQFLKEKEYSGKCLDLLRQLINDDEHEVRTIVNRAFFNDPRVLNLPYLTDFLITYINSKSFRDDPTGLLFTFKDFPGSLLQYSDAVFGMCATFTGPLSELSRNLATNTGHDVSMVSPLILRLYEQSKGRNDIVANHCLDVWDAMFEQRIGIVSELMKQLDQ
jgi:hypothetical protein